MSGQEMPVLASTALRRFKEQTIKCELVTEPSCSLKFHLIPSRSPMDGPMEAIGAIWNDIVKIMESKGVRWVSGNWSYSPKDKHYVFNYGVDPEDRETAETVQKSFGRSLP